METHLNPWSEPLFHLPNPHVFFEELDGPPITWHFRWVSIETYLLIQSSNLESEDLKNGTQMEDFPGFLKWPHTHMITLPSSEPSGPLQKS